MIIRALVAGGLLLAAAPALAVAAAQPSGAQAAARPEVVRTTRTEGLLTVHVSDWSPRFLAWWEAAQAAPDADARFALWNELYGFAAVPPTPEGRAMARRLVDDAWPRYAEVLPAARAGAAGFSPDPVASLADVAGVLELDVPVEMDLVLFVGAFDDNAYAFRGRRPTVAMPVDPPRAWREVVLAHEGAHAIHMVLADLSGGWERSIAATALQEGLAMHASREAVPGRPLLDYVNAGNSEWWATAQANRRAILAGALPDLEKSDSDTVMRYTMGRGSTGLTREAYVIGWFVIERLRAEGMTLGQIARIKAEDMPALVRGAVERSLAEAP